MSPQPQSRTGGGLSLAPFRALRPAVSDERLGRLLCPPYDVIDSELRERLLAGDRDNAVAVVLPDPTPAGYTAAAQRLAAWTASGLWTADAVPALFVYEMAGDSHVTRGLLGAVELRAAEDGVILPHENTMAGPVADRLEVMTRTGADLEPIYLVYDGGGDASDAVRLAEQGEPVATAVTPDGITHRLWAITDARELEAIRADLSTRSALIADGHHRYATYRERQRRSAVDNGHGPWDRGLTLLVDSSDYGPEVHAIHRYVAHRTLADAAAALAPYGSVQRVATDPRAALDSILQVSGFAAVLVDGDQVAVLTDPEGRLRDLLLRVERNRELAALDVSVLHRGVVEQVWGLTDDVGTVGYAHSVEEAVEQAAAHAGFAVLLRPTPVAAVAAVAAAGARMPRKSTLFTPKPASGLLMRRLADQV